MKKHSTCTTFRNVICAALAFLVVMAFPAGYVRYTTTEELQMLDRMAKGYDVDPVYVLDMMYRHTYAHVTGDM